MRGFFYGNWFIGLCAVALGVEAAMQQQVPLNGPWYHAIVFLACVAFYNHAYRDLARTGAGDDRARWYALHGHQQRTVQFVILGVLCIALLWSWVRFQGRPLHMDAHHLLTLLVFPFVGFAYYGIRGASLRRIGWLKPFALGFVWAGLVTVYPVLLQAALHGSALPDLGLTARLFLKNLMFIAVLAVLFDIKDHASDHRNAVKTIVVQRGLRTTLFRIVLPLTLLGVTSFLFYGATHGFSPMKLVLNTVPFGALLAAIHALRKRRTVLYYLAVVDGLMLLKAMCGIAAMRWF